MKCSGAGGRVEDWLSKDLGFKSVLAVLTGKLSMIGEATYIACRHKQQLLPSTKQELPSWIYVRGKVQFKSMCCLEGIECNRKCGCCKGIFSASILTLRVRPHALRH
jgi:hypothetical protein